MFPIHRVKTSVFNYEEIPAGYYYQVMQSGSEVQRFWHREKFREVARKIQDGESVLDVGCGPGSFLSVLGETLPRVKAVGVDVASRQIDFAVKTVQSRFSDGRISFQPIASDKVHLPFENASFDKVTCIEVIEHIHPFLALQILTEMRRVLKPGGRLILTTPNYRSLWPLIEIALERLSKVKYHDQHISKFTPNALVKFLEAGGFELKSLNTIFILAPFLASISRPLAQTVYAIEKNLPVRLGSLLISECSIMEL